MKNGFTLPELLVVITIFSLVTLAAIASFRGADPTRQLALQSSNLVSVLRQAQVQAQAGEPFGGSLPLGGYGVAITTCAVPPCSVTLFADQNGNFSMQSPAEVIDIIPLGNLVTIDAISTANTAHVMFRLPVGAVCFDNVCEGAAPLTITLGAQGTAVTRLVEVNQLSGQISY